MSKSKIMYDLNYASCLSRRIRDTIILEGKELTSQQSLVLISIDKLKKTTTTKLAEHTHLTKATISEHITFLCNQGYIEKIKSDDKRQFFIVLTEKGQAYCQQCKQSFAQFESELRLQLGEEKTAEFGKVLLEITEYFKERIANK